MSKKLKRIVYDDYNFQHLKKSVACNDCQYYENKKCMNKGDCFWLELERKLIALEIIKKKGNFLCLEYDEFNDKYYVYDNELYAHNELTKEEYDLLKEALR